MDFEEEEQPKVQQQQEQQQYQQEIQMSVQQQHNQKQKAEEQEQESQPQVIQSVQKKQPLQLDESKKKIIIRNQIFVFILTFLAYASIHATRTAWSSSKQSLKEDLDEKDDHFLGLVDTLFLLCYAISMKVLGGYSSRFQIQYFLGFGMISASMCLLIIYFICQVSLNKGFILFMMMLNGISQSSGWPSVVACMGNWFGNGKKGLLMGLWGTNGNVGNMLGYFVQDFAVNTLELNWKFVLFIIGIFLLIIGSVVIFNLEPYPAKLGITQEELDLFQEMQSQNSQSPKQQQLQHKGDHVELNEDLEEEKRNQTVVIEMPENKYKQYEDDSTKEEEQQNQIHQMSVNNNNHHHHFNQEQNNNIKQMNGVHQVNQVSDNDGNSGQYNANNYQMNKVQILTTETHSKEKIISDQNSPELNQDHTANKNKKKKDDMDEEDTSSSNNGQQNEILSDNVNNDSLKINANPEIDNSQSMQNHYIDADHLEQKTSTKIVQNESPQEDSINLFNAWIKVPGLAIFALTQGGVKGTIYGLMFWLPIYLQEHGLKSQAAFICSMNEIGTFAGGLILGWLIDKFKMKAAIITLFLGISSIIMLIIHFLPSGTAGPYYLFVLLGGICLGGPYTMLGGAIAIELSQQPEVRHYKNITALLAGVIEGFGSFVAAFVQIIIPLFGQKYIFILFTFSSFFSSFFLIKKAIIEVKASSYFKQ